MTIRAGLARALARGLAMLRGHEDQVRSAAFSDDGTRIVTASIPDRTVRLWHAARGARLAALPVEELVADAKRRQPRQLTPEQEGEFFLVKD